MKKRRKKRNRRKEIRRNRLILLGVIISIVTIGLFGKKLNKINIFHKGRVSAISIQNGVGLIGVSHPTNKEIAKRIDEEKLRRFAAKKEKEEAEKIQEKNRGKKIAYLTFDDGPSTKSTPMILDILNKYDIKATFFVVGTSVEENPDILKRVYDEGHQIGNHTYNHNYDYLYNNAKNFMDDIYKAEKLIKSIVGDKFDSKIVRFPGGSFEARKDPMKKAVLDSGYRFFDWNALNGDAEGASFPEEQLVKKLEETVVGKQKVIILMHDTNQKITTAKSLEESIKFLISEGYEFDILDKNFN